MQLHRAIDQIIAFIATIACVSFVWGLSDVRLRVPPGVETTQPATPSGLRDARLRVAVTDRCASAGDCQPIENAQVRVFWLNEERYFQVGEASTDATGSVNFEELPRGVAWVLVEAKGRARRSERVRLAAGEQVVKLALAHASSATVTVVDENEAPVVRATVLVEGDDLLPHGMLTSIDGNARFDRLGPGPWVIQVSAPGFETVTKQGVRGDVTITLRNLGGLNIKVVDSRGRAAPGATVVIVGSRLWPARRATTDNSGEARVAGLLAGTYDLRAVRGTEVSDTLYGLHLEPSGRQDVTLRLEAGRMVTALVTDGSGEDATPIEGADVVLVEGGLSPFPLQGRTGADGRITLGPIGRDAATLAAGAEGFVSRSAVPVPSDHLDDSPVRIGLLRGAKLVGEVVDTEDRPVDGASVEVVGTDLYGLPVAETPSLLNFRSAHFSWALAGPAPLIPAGELGVVPGPVPPIPQAWRAGALGSRASDELPSAVVSPWVTDWDGSFIAHPVTPGRLRVIVRHPEYVEGVSEVVMLPPGGEARVQIVLHVGGALEGRVVDSRGYPVEGARVDVAAVRGSLERTTLTDRHGEFAFAALPSEVRIGLAAPNELERLVHQEVVRIEENETTEIELTLPDARENVTVVVHDEDDQPVVTAQVTLLSLDPQTPLRQTYFTDEEGRVEFDQARDLAIRVRVEAPRLTPNEQEIHRAPERIVVRLHRGVRVTGTVTSVRGRHFVEGATVTLVAGGARRVAFTDREGTYRFRDVPRGMVRLHVSHTDYASREVMARVEDTGREDRPFEVPPVDLSEAGVVEGHVVDQEGNPVMGARVGVGMVAAYLPVGSLPEGMTVTDMDGRFRLTGVAPGVLTVEAYAAEAGRGAAKSVRVDGGRTTDDVTIRLSDEEVDDEPLSSGNLALTLGERGSNPIDVVIVQVAQGSEAERAGLVAGDVILAVDDVEPESMMDARARLGGRAGSDVVVEVDRNGELLTLRVARERVRR